MVDLRGEAVRVGALPAPDIGRHLVKGAPGPPIENVCGLGDIGPQFRRIARSAPDHLGRQLATACSLERRDQLQH